MLTPCVTSLYFTPDLITLHFLFFDGYDKIFDYKEH